MKWFFVPFVFLLFSSATQIDRDTPRAIKKLIVKFEKNSVCDNSHVDKFKFMSSTVYVFNPGNCGADMQSDVYDVKGKLLGSLGGFAGNNKIKGEDFGKAELQKTIWKKKENKLRD